VATRLTQRPSLIKKRKILFFLLLRMGRRYKSTAWGLAARAFVCPTSYAAIEARSPFAVYAPNLTRDGQIGPTGYPG
jgi:hypothetical protein